MNKLARFLGSLFLVVILGIVTSLPVAAVPVLPDLQPTQIIVTTLYAGAMNAVTVVVANNGDAPASGFTVRLLADNDEVANSTAQSVSAHNDPYYWPLSVRFDWHPVTAGSYTLRAVVDPGFAVAESDETNNELPQAVAVVALTPVTVRARVEGKTATIWSGNVTFSTSTITDKQSTTFTVDHPTALGALNQAALAGGFGYVVSSAYGNLTFIESVGGDANQGLNGWLYRVNAASPAVAAIDYTLAANDEVMFYFGGWMAQPVRLAVDATSFPATQSITATVEAFNEVAWAALPGATLHAGSHIYTTDAAGQVKNFTLPAGGYTLYADKADYTQYIRSNSIAVTSYVPLNLLPGWNFISVPKRLAAGHSTAQQVFIGVNTDGHSIFQYDGAAGWTAMQNATEVRPLDGIWIYSASTTELRPVFDTNPRQVPATKTLAAGWNAVGFTDFTPAAANSALTSVENKWATLLGFDAAGQTYGVSIINNAPDGDPHNEKREMATWGGYWCYMTTAGELAAISQ